MRGVLSAYPEGGLVLVALSGGADSLALAAATAFEAPRANLRAGAVIVDHGLQPNSATVAERAAEHARQLGLSPVRIERVRVLPAGNGPEAAARQARYAALESVRIETGAICVLLGHTRDDQAETVLLGLARGAGPTSLSGMARISAGYVRPLLGLPRSTTAQACRDEGLDAWHDPHNDDERYTRVRVRHDALPALERSLGPGVAEALSRTAEQMAEDDAALATLARERYLMARTDSGTAEAGHGISVAALASEPAAIRQRMIRYFVRDALGRALSRAHTLEVARLVTHWHGQGRLTLPGGTVRREAGMLIAQPSAE